jgi:ABC-type spermidine/putrescine transport system permease subunit II
MEIYNYTKKPLQPKIYALFTLLFIAILLLMILMNILQAKDNGRGRLKNGALSIIRRLG